MLPMHLSNTCYVCASQMIDHHGANLSKQHTAAFHQDFSRSTISLALVPGYRVWVEKKEPGIHCLRMLSMSRISET